MAQQRAEGNHDYLERWYTETYNRPALAQRFGEKSVAFWQRQMLIDLWHRKIGLSNELAALKKLGAKGKQVRLTQESIIEQINDIHAVFELPPMMGDAVAARWDEQLARGEMPDFNKR